MGGKRGTSSERFWRHVEKRGPDECWPWTGSQDGRGYGQISVDGKPMKAYRLSYIIENGEIPEGKLVRHKCDNAICVNPGHLVAGTQSENMKDASERGRLNQKSRMNLRAGAKGFYGAGPKSNGEMYGSRS